MAAADTSHGRPLWGGGRGGGRGGKGKTQRSTEIFLSRHISHTEWKWGGGEGKETLSRKKSNKEMLGLQAELLKREMTNYEIHRRMRRR